MNTRFKLYFFIASMLISLPILAGKDPIAWHLNQSFENPVFSGRTYTISYSFTNQLPLKLVKPLVINKVTNSPTEFSYLDDCTGKRLNPNENCSVQITLIPENDGLKTLQLIIAGYSKNQVPLPLVSTVSQGATTSGKIRGLVLFPLPAQLAAGNAATYIFSFFNRGTAMATNLSATVSQTLGSPNITINTCAGTLPPNSFCLIRGTYTPNATTPSVQQVTATLTFDGVIGSPSSVSTSTTVVAPASGDIVGSLVAPNYLPPIMAENNAYLVQFLFTNTTGGAIPLGLSDISCMDNNGNNCIAFITPGSSSCNIPNLPAHAACQIEASFNAPSATNPVTTYTITGTLNYTGTGSPATIGTTGTVVTALPTSRTFTLVNNCTFPVWFSLNGSAVKNQTCSAGCPAGTACNTNTGTCFWENYGPDIGTSYQLNAGGGANTVTIPAPTFPSDDIQWSGNISASLGCDGLSSCQQATCDNQGGSTSCSPGIGFTQPATQAEITMSINSSDSYDVEVINGFHIPISMIPIFYPSVPAIADNYTCGSPGDFVANNGFGSCNWANATPPSPKGGYYWVTHTATACNINVSTAQCPAGELCGLDGNFNQVCGNFLGFWAANEVCSKKNLSASVYNFFLCNQPLPTSPPATTPPFFPTSSTLYDLMACSVPTGDSAPTFNSCYLTYSNYTFAEIQTCCGCVDWWNPAETGGVAIASNPAAQSCTPSGQSMPQSDPQWTQYIQPMIQWMKAACPSAYTYPFDDKTSGFSCSNNLPNEPNSVGYIITFCQGNTGLPAGITEGRG